MSEDLKPCPFCGGNVMVVRTNGCERDVWYVSRGFGHNMCKCHLFMESEPFESGTEGKSERESLIAAWNTRVDTERGAVPATEENMAEYGWVKERTCTVDNVVYDDLLQMETASLSCGHEVNCDYGIQNYCEECGARIVKAEC